MSLRVWLPLNRDIHNQGLSSVTVTNNGATLSNCAYSFNGSSQYLQYGGFNASEKSELSVCLWAKPNSTNFNGIFGINTTTTAYQFSITSANKLGVRDNKNGPTGTRTEISLWTPTSGEWYHICCTYKNGAITVYKNGLMYDSASTGGSALCSNLNNYFVGAGAMASGDYFNGSLYDVRIYDHALSKKEVAEIARGCILHYPMNDILNESTVNLTDSTSWESLYWNIVSQTENELKLSKSENNETKSVYLRNNTLKDKLQANTTITVSGYLYKGETPYKTSSVQILSSRYNNPTTLSYESRDDGYFRFTFTYGNLDSGWLIGTSLFGTDVSTGDICYIRNMQWELKDHATQYTPNYRNIYNKYEYLQSDGTAYIDTGIVYDSTKTTYRIECEFSQPSNKGSYDAVFGAYQDEPYKTLRIIRLNSDNKMGIYYNNQASSGSRITLTTSNANTKKVIMTSSTITVEENGIISTYDTPATNGTNVTNSPHLCLFARTGGVGNSYTRIHYFRMYDGNILLVDYIPVQYNGVYGMWDLVTNTFKGNSKSSGAFSVGPLVEGNYLKDVSGFDNHSLITGSLPLVTTPKSPRYDKCMNVTATNYAQSTLSAPQIKSCSMWIYVGDHLYNDTEYGIVYSDAPHETAFGFTNAGNIICRCQTSTSMVAKYSISSLYKANSWNHFVTANNGTSIDVYLNGTKLTGGSTGGWGGRPNYFTIGKKDGVHWLGKISDFRLFTRTLTQADVDDLYKDSFAIDKSQNGYCYELNESDTLSSVDIKKNGLLLCKNYSEQFDGLYLPAGTYVDTLLNYTVGDICKAETFIKYDSGGSGRDLMGFSSASSGYWGVKADGTWDQQQLITYTDSDITKYNRINYEWNITSSSGNYKIGTLGSGSTYSVRNKTIYHARLWKNGTLERDLYPCSINNQVGLIDGLTGTFYPAQKISSSAANASIISNPSETRIGKNGNVTANQLYEL